MDFRRLVGFIVIALLCALPLAGFAIGGEDEYYGVAPYGMGEAYTGSYGDISSTFWNPAGLGAIRNFQTGSMFSDLYGLGIIKQGYAGFAVPWGKSVHGFSYALNSISFDYSSISGFSGLGNLDWREVTMAYSFARPFIFHNFYLGTNVKYYNVNSNLNFAGGRATGYGLDLGALWRATDKLSLGASVKNAAGNMKWDSGFKEDMLMIYRFGVQYHLNDRIRLLADFVGDDNESFHYAGIGGEAWLWKSYRLGEGDQYRTHRQKYFEYLQTRRTPQLYGLSLRGGAKRDMDASLTSLSAGAGLMFGPLRFDYSFRFDDQSLGNTNFASLAFEMGDKKKGGASYSALASPQEAEEMLGLSYQDKLSISDVPTSTQVAVANFVNLTNRPDLDWLELGIADMLYNELMSSGWDMLDRLTVAQSIGTTQVTVETSSGWARQLGANKLVYGFFSDDTNGDMRVDVYVFDAKTGKTRQTSLNTTMDRIYSIGSELAFKVIFL